MGKKKKKAEKITLIKISACPPPERFKQEGGIEWDDIDRNNKGEVIEKRAKAKISCKLDWYLHAGTITADMQQAGNKFSRLHFSAGKMPRTTPMYGDFVSGRRGHDPYLTKTDAVIALEEALSVLTPQEKDVIWDVCGNDQYAGTPVRTRQLITGLRALVTHFKIHV